MVPPTSATGADRGLVFTGTAMELPSPAGPVRHLEGLTLRLTTAGIAVEGPGRAPGSTAPWYTVEEARCGESGFLPGGEPAVAVSATVAGTFVRWLVPSDQLPPDRAAAVDVLLVGRSGPVAGVPPYWAPRPLRGGNGTGATAGNSPVPTGSGGGARSAAAGLPPEPAPARAPRPDRVPRESGEEDAQGPGSEPVLPLITPVFRPAALPPGEAAAVPAAVMTTTPARHPPVRRDTDPWRRPSPRTLLAALWTLLVLLLTLAALLYVAGLRQSVPAAASSAAAVSADRLLAVELNLGRTDVPAGWTVDTSATGPLAGFLGAGVDGSGGAMASPRAATPAERRQQDQVARHFAACLGVPPAADRIFGTGGPRPVARSSSPAFAGPPGGPPLEAGTVSTVYPSGTTVSMSLAQALDKRFPTCFGQAVARAVHQATSSSNRSPTSSTIGGAVRGGTTATYGTPSVSSWSLPQAGRVRAAGVELDFPVSVNGAHTAVQLGFVFVGGGRAESTLYTFGTATGFPATVASRLTRTLERHITSATRSTGA